jgi:alkanesulfonate monooxygenase SsuD/methylene tetrahydromethanopterin reductase-like flavin-dependent oxidoreductase (luciferase family)
VADEAGFDSCWVMDHFATLGAQDDGPIFETWTMLAALGTADDAHPDRVRGRRQHLPPSRSAGEDGCHGRPRVRRTAGFRHRRRLGAERARDAGAGVRQAERPSDRLEESIQIILSLWTQPRTTFEGKHYRLQDAVAEPKPVQRPYPPIWIGGSGPKRTLRITRSTRTRTCGTRRVTARRTWPPRRSAILDQHCGDVGRDPSQIRRSVQLRVARDELDQVRATSGYRTHVELIT